MFTTLTTLLGNQNQTIATVSKGQNAIIVIKSELQESEQEKAKGNIIGHIPDALVKVICPFLEDGTITSMIMTGEITGVSKESARGHLASWRLN